MTLWRCHQVQYTECVQLANIYRICNYVEWMNDSFALTELVLIGYPAYACALVTGHSASRGWGLLLALVLIRQSKKMQREQSIEAVKEAATSHSTTLAATWSAKPSTHQLVGQLAKCLLAVQSVQNQCQQQCQLPSIAVFASTTDFSS